jgi:hypothetical protein
MGKTMNVVLLVVEGKNIGVLQKKFEVEHEQPLLEALSRVKCLT